MADKKREEKCIEWIIDCNKLKNQKAKEISDFLKKNRKNIEYDFESPDIIVQSDSELWGIEHFQVDVLFKIKNRKAQSLVGMQNNKIDDLVEKYSNNPEKLDADIENGKAIGAVLQMVSERHNYKENFKYNDFVNNFKSTCLDHHDKCEAYRKNLLDYSNNKRTILGCIIEVPYPKVREYIIYTSKGSRRQALNELPITNDMLKIIKSLKNYNFVILCLHCVDFPNKSASVYYFSPTRVEEDARTQNIHPVVCFDFGEIKGLKTELIFPDNKIEHDEEKITAEYQVKIKGIK